jgi:hypothetical protein
MAVGRPQWLDHLSRSFKRHRGGRTGWTVEVMRDRLRVVSSELPPRSDEPVETVLKRRSVTLNTPPGPATSAAALQEACGLFDAVMAVPGAGLIQTSLQARRMSGDSPLQS